SRAVQPHAGSGVALRPADHHHGHEEFSTADRLCVAPRRRCPHFNPRRVFEVLHADSRQRTCRLSREWFGWAYHLYGDTATDRIPNLSNLRSRERRSPSCAGQPITRTRYHHQSGAERVLYGTVRAVWPGFQPAAELSG